MMRLMLGAAFLGALYLGWHHLPTSEQLEANRESQRTEREEARLAAKAEYVRQNLPQGCTIDHLPKYGPVENIVMVRCAGLEVTTTNNQWQESRTYTCGKSLCTTYDDKHSAVIDIKAPEQGQ